MRGGAPPRMKIAHSGGLMAIFMEVHLHTVRESDKLLTQRGLSKRLCCYIYS
jgi:hypothetical protein